MHLTAWSSDEFDSAEVFLTTFTILLEKAIATSKYLQEAKGTEINSIQLADSQLHL